MRLLAEADSTILSCHPPRTESPDFDVASQDNAGMNSLVAVQSSPALGTKLGRVETVRNM